jgi:hypothetical protein
MDTSGNTIVSDTSGNTLPSKVEQVEAPSVPQLLIKHAGGKDGFPLMDGFWDIFSSKGIRTVFLTIGTSSSVAADLELGEGLGCPIHYVPLSSEEREKWAEVSKILKERKRDSETAKFSFTQGAETKWVLPKNIREVPALPWWTEGTVQIGNGEEPLRAATPHSLVQPLCATMKLKDGATRIDLLKIDTVATAPALEIPILGSIFHNGFRPTLLLVNWSKMPDTCVSTTIAAGHLQNLGYKLMAKNGSKFLYFFTDDDMYLITSWEDTFCTNPLVREIVNATKSSLRAEKVQQK